MRKIAVANQKGGVGKTTVALNLAHGLAQYSEYDNAVLLIDLDPQSNSTSSLIGPEEPELSAYDFLMEHTPLADVIREVGKHLFLLPATIDLAGAEAQLMGVIDWQYRLRSRLAESDLSAFDYLIIDCPPSLGILTVNALVAVNEVLTPIVPGRYSFKGVAELQTSIEKVRANLGNTELHIEGVVLNMTDYTRVSDGARAEIAEHFHGRVFESAIPRSVKFEESNRIIGGSIFSHAGTSPAALAMGELVREVCADE